MLRIAATIGLKTYYFASEDVDYDNTFWEARISNQFEIERFFDISESTGNRIRSMQITLDNRDNFFKDIEANASLLNSKFVLYFNDGDDKVKTFTGKVNKIDSFGDDISLTLMERGYEYLKNNFPDAQIAYDYYSESGINDSWNAIPIPFGSVNKIPLAWVNLFRSEFIIGSGPLFNVNKLYFDKVVVYDRIEEKNGYQPTPESQEIKFRIFKGTGSVGSPEVVDGVTSEYPGFAYVQLYKIVDGVEEPADPLTPDGDVSQIYADIEGIVNDTGTAPERNPIKILYMLFTKPYTGYEGYGLEIDPDDLDFDDAILEANIQGFKIDGAIDRIAEFGEWVDELLRCARASLTEEDGKIKVYVDSPKPYSGVHFDASGDNGYECDISPWTEPEVDAQINRLRLSYSWNFERNDFNKKPGVHEESPLRDPYLKDEAHAERIGTIGIPKWNTDTIEFKLIKDDITAHKLAQYYLKSKVKQLKTTSLVTEVRIPNIDAGDLVKVSYEKFGWVEKEFVVTKIKRNEDSTELDIKEYSIDVYTFVSPGEEPEVPGNPHSPYNIPTKPIMNYLEVVNTILQDGSNQTLIKVEFTHTSENAHMVALYFKEASDPESAFWQLDTTVNKNVITTIWKGRVTGDYNFRIATITSMGIISPITIEDGDRHYYGQPTEEIPVSVHVDYEAPGTPSISIVNPFVGGVSIYITIPDGIPEDFAYFKIFRKLGGLDPDLLATYHTSAVFTDSDRETAEHSRVYYAVAVDRNGNESAMSAASAESIPLKVGEADLSADAIKMPTGAILSLTAKNCTTESIAEVNGVKDVSGNGNHGRAYGGVEVVDSEMGKAFQFDGVDDYIIDNSVTYNNATEWSFSAWVKKNAFNQGQCIYSDYSGSNRNIKLGYEHTEGIMRFEIGSGTQYFVLDTTGFVTGELIHWAFTFKGGEYMRIYRNGILVANKTTDVPASIAAVHNNRFIGMSDYPRYFNGLIAHPKIFNRALSPSEIKTLYMFPDDVAFGQITTDFIGANAVTAGKTLLAAIDNVTGDLNNSVVGELQLVNAAVTEAKIAVNAVNTEQINNQAMKAPNGAILSLTAKNCTTASIAEVNGVKDVSGNGNHGQAYGGVEVVDSEMGKAFKFDGVDDYIIDNSITYENATEFTVSVWAKKTGYNQYQGIYSDYSSGLKRSVILGYEDVEGRMRFEIGDGTNFTQVPVSNVFIQDEWAHWTGVFKGSEYTRLYKNGVLIGERIAGVPEKIAVSHCNRYFGRYASKYFNGLIAHPKIFKRALSPSEIKTLYMFPDDVAFGQITADLVTTGKLITKSTQIEDAIITDAHIHDLSADKINAGTIAAERIAAGSINASKLLIGRAGAALNDDPNFEDRSAWIVPNNGTIASVTDGQVGGNVARQSIGYGIWRNVKYIPIDRSKTYRVRLWIRTDSAGNGASKSVSISTNYYTAIGGIEDMWLSHGLPNIPITTSWQEFSYIINGSDFPYTAKYMRNRIGLFNGTGTGYHEMQDLRIEEVIPATLIKDGSIITQKLAVGAVTADKLLIGKSGSALNDDPNFEDLSAWEKTPYQPFNFLHETNMLDGKVGRYGLRSVSGLLASVMTAKDIPYDPSKTYRIRAWVRATVATETPSYLGVRWRNATGDNGDISNWIPVSPIEWTEYVIFIGDGTSNIAPVDTVAVRPYFIANFAQVTGVSFDIQDLRIEECVPSTLIKDGAIRAQHITVDEAIITNKLQILGEAFNNKLTEDLDFIDTTNNANTANTAISNMTNDNKLTPDEKQAIRKEWDIIAAELPVNNTHAMGIAGFTIGIAEGSFNEAASDAYWSECWTKLNTLLGESNPEPAFPAQTFVAFSAEEVGYYTMVKQVIDSEPITVPPTPDVLTLITTYNNAFQALANYLNAGTTWSSGVPSWIADANLATTTDIVGSTFRSTWKNYYDARTALLNAIAAKSKLLADSAQNTADTAKTAVDNWAVAGTNYTEIKGGVITTGQIKSGDYVPPVLPSGGFAVSGSSYDLDNATITTANFYSNENGAGIKGHIEADSGNIGDWIIGRGLIYDNTVGLDRTILTLGGAGESLYLSRNYASQAQDTVNITPAFSTFFYSDVNSPNISETDAATRRVTFTTNYLRMQNAILNNEAYESKLSASRLEIFSPDNSQCSLNSKTLTLAGNTSSTVTIDSDNPKIVFESADRTQKAALVFTDADSYAAPASVSLVGNQGNEVFAAPRFRANAPIGPASVLLSGGIHSVGESAIFGLTYSGAAPVIGFGVKPHPSTHGQFVSSYGANLGRIALLLDGSGFRVFTGGVANIPVGTAVSMTERFKIDHNGVLTLNGYATSQSRTNRGYLKFNGIIIQWGREYFPDAGWFPVTFPTQFSSSYSWGLANTSSDDLTGCRAHTSTGCYMLGRGNDVYWVAIGY